MHTMAFEIPRPCPNCSTMMERVMEGVKCPQCSHRIFDPGGTEKCACAKCAQRAS